MGRVKLLVCFSIRVICPKDRDQPLVLNVRVYDHVKYSETVREKMGRMNDQLNA